MADLIPFPRLHPRWPSWPCHAESVAKIVQSAAEAAEPCRATSEYLNRPCRSVAELEALLRARADVTAAREGV